MLGRLLSSSAQASSSLRWGSAALHTCASWPGNAAAAIPISSWLLAFSMFLFLSLALVKRYAELRSRRPIRPEEVPGVATMPRTSRLLSQLGMASGLHLCLDHGALCRPRRA